MGPLKLNSRKLFCELVQTCAKENFPFLFGGDFNIIRNLHEKNNDTYDDRWPFLFNVVIDSLNLRELELSNPKFTWENSRDVPTYETLDCILVSTEWESKFRLSIVQALNREILYHTPLLLNSGSGAHTNKHPPIQVFLSWWRRSGIRRNKVGHHYKDDNSQFNDLDNSLGVGCKIQVIHIKRKRKR